MQGTWTILCMCPTNERWRYNVTSSLIGWAHTQNDPWVNILGTLLLKPRSHMYCNLSATALRLNTAATYATTVRSKLHFFGCWSIGNWLATTIPKSRRPVEDRSATGWRLIANWMEMGCDWSATGRRQVGDGLATDYRSNNLLCRCNHE